MRLALTPPAGPATLATASHRPSPLPTPQPRENPVPRHMLPVLPVLNPIAHIFIYIFSSSLVLPHPGQVVNPTLPTLPSLLNFFCNRRNFWERKRLQHPVASGLCGKKYSNHGGMEKMQPCTIFHRCKPRFSHAFQDWKKSLEL